MRGVVGLVIGLVVGAGAMYLVLRPPWGGGAAPPDAGVEVVSVPSDAGAKPKRKKPGARPVRPAGGGRQSAGSDFHDDGSDDSGPVAPKINLSAAERALEWRGDNTSISRKIDMNAPDSARPLEQGEINATVSSQTAGVRQCVVSGAAGTDLTATITVKMVVEGTGKVSRSQLQAPRYLFEKGLLGCAQGALRGMSFPATGTPTLVTFPVTLTIN